MLHSPVGRRIRRAVLGQERAQYGERVVEELAGRLTEEFGRGFTRTNLFYMIRFAEVFPDAEIVHTLCGLLSWSHFRLPIGLDLESRWPEAEER